ncbi:MAG: hypothetical protein A7316_10540 [Candidatus Altiarchaeales archaeon WOR_SM1_86-2]|nr:MAG: hypothetical protein A7316_10540 [Candidatus Altiarchaeales archaeon WOR_SM1_86-2]
MEELNEKLKKDVEKAADFHGDCPPGIPIGVYMVDYALELLGDYKKLKCVAETPRCLTNAVQVMTSCTLGNPYFKLIDYGKYAFTLYDRETGEGVRVYLDVKKLDRENYPLVSAWFLRDKSPMSKLDKKKVTQEFLTKAGRDILSYQKVKVNLPPKDKLYHSKLCKVCGESFISKDDEVCAACDGRGYYAVMKK